MPLPGQHNGHSTYRLFLTLSIAFLLHTLILAAALHNWILQPEPEASTVRFTLLANSEKESKESRQSRSSSASAASTDTAGQSAPASSSPRVITRTAEPAKSKSPLSTKPEEIPLSTPDRTNSPAPESTPQKAVPQGASSPKAITSMSQTSGSPVDTPDTKIEQRRAQIPQKAVEQDPYITLLWQYISQELDSRPVRSIHDLTQVRTVRLELHLMENGALRRVDTIKSSGKQTLDQAARQSALAASPYPRPPESAREQGFRFQVELRFTPRSGN